MSSDLPARWPDRPTGFYEVWSVFGTTLLNAVIQKPGGESRMASLLLAGGAGLGAAGMIALIQANKPAIDRKGKEWGVPNLTRLLQGGGALVGAALGGFGGAMLTRLLSRHADREFVDDLQRRLADARAEFEELLRDRGDGVLNEWAHRAAVELLFARLVSEI